MVFDRIAGYGSVFCVLSLLYMLLLGVYRIYLSPLSRFPGSRLAIATGWYEFYYDFAKRGKYIFEIERMHRRYGPIIRINAHEIHIHDPDFYEKLYVTNQVVDNYNRFNEGIDFEGSHFLSISHELHKSRRKPLEPFFSPQGVRRLESMISNLARKLSKHLEAVKRDRVLRLDHAFIAFSGDVILRICSDRKDDLLDDPAFSSYWFEMLHSILKSMPLMTGLPWLIRILQVIPQNIMNIMLPDARHLLDLQNVAKEHIIHAKQEKHLADTKGLAFEEHGSLFRSVLNSDMSESELSTERLSKEAQVLFAAGSVTTARTLDFICFYILSRPDIEARLRQELSSIWSSEETPSVAELQKVEYLQALIKEGLRLSHGVMHRHTVCHPNIEIQYQDWKVPRNTPIGMSPYMNHMDHDTYPNPKEFIPERWLDSYNPRMDRNLVSFSRGSRRCLGQHLAMSEMYIMLAVLFRPGAPKLQLFETDASDAEPVHDLGLPLPRLDSKGIRVLVV